MRLVDSFKIYIKAKPNQGYFATIYNIEKPYLLKPGDKLFLVNYGRNIDWRDVTILNVTDEYLTLIGDYCDREKIYNLHFEKEPDYAKMLGAQYKVEPEQRKLEIVPFPVFVDTFEKSMLNKAITPGIDLFHKSRSFPARNYKEYIRNFENISDLKIRRETQMSILANIGMEVAE